MKRFLLLVLFFLLLVGPLYSYKILYAEQFYKLYHSHFLQYPENINENIQFLEMALKTPFVNPLNALTKIENQEEWERYRYLFKLHVNLELIKQYRLLGSKYDKRKAYFYNYPWKEDNLKSLEIAEAYYQTSLYYWEQAKNLASQIDELPYLHLSGVQYWEDEYARISTGELDYKVILKSDIERLNRVREDFLAMDDSTY